MGKEVISIKSLGLTCVNGVYELNKPIDELILIEEACKIVVSNNVTLSFLDTTNNQEVNMTITKNCFVNYIVLDSCNAKRVFANFGSLELTEISFKESNEALLIDLLAEKASANIKYLAIATAMSNRYSQSITHNAKETISNIANVGVAMNKAKIIFDTTGKIINKMAKSKCSQLSRGIVMDDDSEVTAKPILLIDEYDVVANHGATIGKMSDEDLFYLMSRGLSKKDAFLLILQGIVAPYVNAITSDTWKDKIMEEIKSLIVSD